jgi:hypothetical protein
MENGKLKEFFNGKLKMEEFLSGELYSVESYS